MAALLLFLADLPAPVELHGVLGVDKSQCILFMDDGKELLAVPEAWRVSRRCPPLQGHAGCRVRVLGVLSVVGSGSEARRIILIWHIGPADRRKHVEVK